MENKISNREQLIFNITQLEWDMFQHVYNTGGRASCQDDPDTFFKMRMSQWLAYSDELLDSYMEDLKSAYQEGRNFFFEKYTRMMETTFVDEYERVKEHLPDISDEQKEIVEEIVKIHVTWDAIVMEQYPNIRKRGRVQTTDQDSIQNGSSMESYLRGEPYTYSMNTLTLLYQETKMAESRGENLLKDIISNETKFYGYESIETAEKSTATWYKLDLSAIVYPTLQRKDFSSVYRLSVVLKEKIQPEILQQAVDKAMPRFPTYKAAIRKGLFWRYLEPNHRPGPFVQPDIKNPCMPMSFKANNRYLVRIYYYDCRISLEAHHSLGDGTGGMCVLQTITAVYLRLLGKQIENDGFVLDVDQSPEPQELEDAYMKYANASVCPPRLGEKAYRIRGTKEPFYTLNIVDGIMSVKEVLEVSKKYHATMTEYLNAVLLYALLQKQEQDWHLRLRPVKIAMPVNLRRFFPSKTLRNFITMVYPSIDPRLGDYTFEEIVEQVHHYMKYYINEKFLRGDITTNAATQTNPLIRVVPLFLKDLVVRTFYTKVQDKNSSAGLTNMGALYVTESMKPYIERFDIYMGQPFSSRTNCAIISYEDTLTINFASSIIEADVERFFFRKLVQDGIHVKIESNRELTEE